MDPKISLFFRLLNDVYSGLELLDDLTHSSGCPYSDDIRDSLNYLGLFRQHLIEELSSNSDNVSNLPF